MKTVSFKNVTLTNGFLYEKQELNKNMTINAVYDRFYDTGRIGAFNFDWREGMENAPHNFWDSDVAKWMEGAAYILQKEKNPELEAKVESLIDKIEEHQCADGYFNIHFTIVRPSERFKGRDNHELYCAGHLFEAACAYYDATGRDRFLRLMEKYADCIEKVFVEEKSAAFVTPGHEEIELALIKMYRTTGKKKYLDLAAFFINNRGCAAERDSLCEHYKMAYNQSHLPVREQTEAVGHAVRGCYLYTAMADFAYETGDTKLYAACKKIFTDIVTKKMFITGGIGQARKGEAFADAYDLENERAYTETCAAISLMYFAHRMQRFENSAIYAEVIERILYNGMISGLSLDGKAFFYENPLEVNMKHHTNPEHEYFGTRYAITERVEVFNCSCCPPNVNRVLASIGDYIYGCEEETVYVNQFAGSSAEVDGMKITQKTDFPKNGNVKIITENVKRLCVRIPSWCDNFTINAEYSIKDGYAVIDNPGSEVEVNFEMTPFLVQSNAEVFENAGKAAVCFGPYVCAAEAIDNVENLYSVFIDKSLCAETEYSDEMCGFKLRVKAFRKITDSSLYSRYSEELEDLTLNMIPYAAFANRGEASMRVWFNVL